MCLQQLKDVSQVFATVIKNDDILAKEQSLLQSIQNDMGVPSGLPKISDANDVYHIGAVAHAVVKEDL